jgi:hypothetical protein
MESERAESAAWVELEEAEMRIEYAGKVVSGEIEAMGAGAPAGLCLAALSIQDAAKTVSGIVEELRRQRN